MKTITVLRNGLFLFPLLCLVSYSIQGSEAPTDTSEKRNQHVSTERPQMVLEYESPTAFMKAFLDISKNTDKKLLWWAAQMYLLCKQDANLKQFSVQLVQAARNGKSAENPETRATHISMLFVQHQRSFSPELQSHILNIGLKKVLAILRVRAQR